MNPLAEADVQCPYCGEFYPATVDTSQGPHQTIEDCPVCCRPILLEIDCSLGEIFSLIASRA